MDVGLDLDLFVDLGPGIFGDLGFGLMDLGLGIRIWDLGCGVWSAVLDFGDLGFGNQGF